MIRPAQSAKVQCAVKCTIWCLVQCTVQYSVDFSDRNNLQVALEGCVPLGISPPSQPLSRLGKVYSTLQCMVQSSVRCTVCSTLYTVVLSTI